MKPPSTRRAALCIQPDSSRVSIDMNLEPLRLVLKKIRFPATKNEVEQQSLHRGIDEENFNLLRQLPQRMYRSASDVLEAIPESVGNAFLKIFKREP